MWLQILVWWERVVRIITSPPSTMVLAVTLTASVIFDNPYLSLVAVVYVWWARDYKNPPMQPIPKIKADEIQGFYRWKEENSKLFPDWIRTAKNESGLIWEGFGLGVSKITGKVEAYSVYLYGSNEGVGHYSYRARENTFRGNYSEGHFNLMPFELGSDTWEMRVLSDIGYRLGKEIGKLATPIHVVYEKDKIIMYDPESGRDVYFNRTRTSPLDDLFVFGPYPSKRAGAYSKKPGLVVSPTSPSVGLKRIIFGPPKDIYDHFLEHAHTSVFHNESNYEYTQYLGTDGDTSITIPSSISKIDVLVQRAGYKELKTTIDLADGNKRVEVVLEPLRGE